MDDLEPTPEERPRTEAQEAVNVLSWIVIGPRLMLAGAALVHFGIMNPDVREGEGEGIKTVKPGLTTTHSKN